MFRARITTGFCLALLSGSLLAPSASAQDSAQAGQGFAINRYNPSERGSEWFALESLDLRGHLRPALGLTIDYAHKPLAIYSATGEERLALIGDQVFLHLGGTFVLWDRLRLGVNMPVALLNAGSDGSAEGFDITAPTGAAAGDLRVGVDVRLFGLYGDRLTAALGAQVFLPTGTRASFTGDEKVRLLPRLSLAGSAGVLTYAALIGVQYRALDDGFVGKETGTELTGGVSAGIRVLSGKLVIGPELFGSTVIASAVEAPSPSKSPLELLMGAHYTAGQLRLGAGAGPGLTRGIGAPAVRVLGSIEWVPPSDGDKDGDGIFNKADACVTIPGPPSADPKKHGCPPDRDGDTIYDQNDACPELPGVRDPDPKKNGCPADRDGDTIYDKDDACPDVLGAPSQDVKRHGCPVDQSTGVMVLLDRDADGVLDGDDKCVDVPGLKEAPAGLTAEQKTDWAKRFIGCPEDTDKDKIVNVQDACPYNPGKPSKDPTKNGCPLALIDACQIRITDRVYFKTSSDKIETLGDKGKTSQAVLLAVIEILKDNAHLKKVEVQGHASQDTSPKNQELSDKRAAAVVTWLVQHGVDATRLVPKGYGTTLPAPGVSMEKAYKELHQRVEFYVIEPQCAAPAPSK